MNHAWLALLLSLGERLGLHEVLAAADRPLTAAELAARAGADERYVREWAWGMAAGALVVGTVDEAGIEWFRLVEGYEQALTARGGAQHWSRITMQVTALAALEDDIVAAFRTGGGVSAARYEGRIVKVLEAESGPIFAQVLLEEVVPLLGVTDLLRTGARVLDLGCGTGQAVAILGAQFQNSRFLGVDQSPDSVAAARRRTAQLDNVSFAVLDIEDALPQGPFDLVMAANVVHDLSDPVGLLTRLHAITAPGGVVYLHELGFGDAMPDNVADPHSLGVLAFGIYHCLPLARRRPGIAPGGMWGRSAYEAALRSAGFVDVVTTRAPSDPNNDTIIARRPAVTGRSE
ncbi:transcriptional regulator [Dactylosporangium sucinum]|uniref:Transcriptional regulator n=2 Tax=Dactylosporangium sucinum TaxID=1424081 RepID=A0A917UFP2_9ACTN|nr:transcriptional regulator [Dactylosporangium sucinum]